MEKGTPADCKSDASIKKRGKGVELADYLPGFCIKVVKLFLASVFSAANGIDFGICVPGCFFEGGQWGKGLDLGEF